MAPALTQTAEPPNLVDATCHTPDSNTTTTSPYDNLKELSKNKIVQSPKRFFESEQILLSNGDCVPSGLAPPACGWAEGRPLPNSSPCRSNMDEQPPVPLTDSGNSCTTSEQPPVSNSISSNSNMGLQSCITNIDAASSIIEKGTEAATTTTTTTSSSSSTAAAAAATSTTTTTTTTQDNPNAILNDQNELLALVGRDFDNVSDIIDTLQRLVSDPELLDAAARDLEPETGTQNASHSQSPEDRAAFVLGRLAERQRQLERRRLFYLRRLRRVTARGLGMTVSSQLSHLTRHARSVLEEERAKQPEENKKVEEPIGLEMLHKESMKSMSTSDLISLVRRVEASNNLQRLNDAMSKKNEAKEVLSLPSSLCAQLDTVASEMRAAALAHFSHDSDATESSSGGESCDEAEVLNNINTNYEPIRERAFYRYCRTRGWVASKWMWLQAQIADLNYKILQHQKIHSHFQKSKGAVQLAEEKPPLKGRPPLRNPAHLDMQDPALTCIGSTTPRTILNGYHPSNKIEEMSSLHGYTNSHEVLSGCARTLGIEKVKRRRYVKPSVTMLKRGLGGTSNSTNKVNKVSPVLCKCIPPLACILCIKSRTTGKNNVISFGNNNNNNNVFNSNKLGAIAFFNQSVSDKLSKVDQAFHPVLSRHTEMLQGELYNTVLKSCEWQQKALINKPLSQRENTTSNSINHFESLTKKKKKDKEHKRNGRRKHAREEGKERPTLKFKKSVLTDALEREREFRETKRRKIENRTVLVNTKRNLNDDDGDDGDDELSGWQVSMGGSAYSSPCQSPALLEKEGKNEGKGTQVEGRNTRKQSTITRQKQNSTSNSFDINNIVIPYSMAATSRVELLQYKEIPTPKWRVEEIAPIPLSSKNEDEDEEDISEEAIISRHRKSEEMEHRKFLQYLHTQVNSSRSSRSRRADSSGTNTPDHPLSPRPLEPMETSPIGSPPDTPLLAPSEDSNQSSHTSTKSANQSTVLTLSLSSLQSSLLKSNPPPATSESEMKLPPPSIESEDNDANLSLKSHKVSNCVTEGGPALRTRRLFSGNVQLEKLRSNFLNEEQNEKDSVSPFPCRHFPLNENEYQDLVCENQCKNLFSNPILRSSLRSHQSNVPPTTIPVHRGADEEPVGTPTGTDVESGRDSPLSELTDSAPEEEGSWDDGTSPDWTISAVNDHCGGFVLTVQRN